VLQKVGAGDTALTAKEKLIHEKGLVAVLKQLHEELDAAVLDAYGWHDLMAGPFDPSTSSGRTESGRADFEQTLLARLVALNAERAAEEAAGTIRWLRPAFQNPQAAQAAIGLEPGDSGRRNQKPDAATSPRLQPALRRSNVAPTLPDQLAAVARILADTPTAQTEAQLAAHFTGKGRWKSRLPDILEALAALGRARRLDDGRWMG
jgi:hypothetical protein